MAECLTIDVDPEEIGQILFVGGIDSQVDVSGTGQVDTILEGNGAIRGGWSAYQGLSFSVAIQGHHVLQGEVFYLEGGQLLQG